MLVQTLKQGTVITVGDFKIRFLKKVRSNKFMIGIEAPEEFDIGRISVSEEKAHKGRESEERD